jgi:hypothetical protein
MAKRIRGSQIPPSTQGDESADAPTYSPFLKVEHLDQGKAFQLTGWARELDGQYGKQIVAEVVQTGTGVVYDFAVKVGSPNHRELHERFGADPMKWRGTIDLTKKAGMRGPYIVIERVPF